MDLGAKVVKWLQTQGRRAGVDCTHVEVSHLNGDATLTQVGSYPVPSLDELQIGELAGLLVMTACEHASLLQGLQVYQLAACWQEGERIAAHSTMLLRVEGRGDDGLLSPSEPANERGITGQLMRHLEAQAKISALVQGTAMTHLQKMLLASTQRVERLEADRIGSLELIEKFLTGTHARELATMKEERNQKRLDHGAQLLGMLTPTIAAGIAKKAGLGEITAAMDTAALAMWLKSLTHEQFSGLLQRSTQEQAAVLLSAYKRLALAGEPEAAAADDGKPVTQ